MWENFFVSLGIPVKYFLDIYGYVFGAIFLEVFIVGAASQHTSRFIETGRNGCFKVNFINDFFIDLNNYIELFSPCIGL